MPTDGGRQAPAVGGEKSGRGPLPSGIRSARGRVTVYGAIRGDLYTAGLPLASARPVVRLPPKVKGGSLMPTTFIDACDPTDPRFAAAVSFSAPRRSFLPGM